LILFKKYGGFGMLTKIPPLPDPIVGIKKNASRILEALFLICLPQKMGN